MRKHYNRRRDLLRNELNKHLGGLLDVHTPEAGMHLIGWLPPSTDDRRARVEEQSAPHAVLRLSSAFTSDSG